MDLYTVIKYLHVLAAIAWVGGGIMEQILGARARRATDRGKLISYIEDAAWTGTRFFMPASFAALGTGIWGVIEGPWEFHQLWVTLGIVGFALTALTGMAVLSPQAKKLGAAVSASEPDWSEVDRRVKTILNVGRVDLLVLIAVVWVMVAKPGM